jgi:hypothetical protein
LALEVVHPLASPVKEARMKLGTKGFTALLAERVMKRRFGGVL